MNIYAPNSGQMPFQRKLWKNVSKLQQGRVVICGDFNLPLDTSIDIKGPSLRKTRSSALLPFLHTHALYDIWRCQHSMEKDFIFFSKPHHTYSRIDLFLGDKQLLQDALDSITWSEHEPMMLTLGEKQEGMFFTNWHNNPYLMSTPVNNIQIQNQLRLFHQQWTLSQ